MARVKRAMGRKTRKKAIAKASKGFHGGRGRYRQAMQGIIKAETYAYIGRKQRKRHFRALWIQRISAALMPTDLNYSRFMHGLTKAGIELNRKQLAELAVNEPAAFDMIVEQARGALA